MPLTLSELCQTFRERALWTGELIRDGFASQLGVMEETITDQHLIEIMRRHRDFVLTKKFSRRFEGSISGADWVWCIGGPGGWLPVLVQAKIIDPKNGKCSGLDFRAGEQRRKLVEFAKKHRFFPVYCVYSYLPDGFVLPA